MLTLKRLVIAGLVTVIAASTGLRNGQGQQGIIEVLDHMRHALSPKEVPETIQAPAASGASALTEAEGSENHTRLGSQAFEKGKRLPFRFGHGAMQPLQLPVGISTPPPRSASSSTRHRRTPSAGSATSAHRGATAAGGVVKDAVQDYVQQLENQLAVGVTEPTATFSACFGAPFMVWHPAKYAELLADKMAKHNVNAWLINTGWTGGAFGAGHRMSLKDTRAIIDAIHSGDLAKAEYENFPRFNLQVPKTCPNVDAKILMPNKTWLDQAEFERMSAKLAGLFKENFKKFEDGCSEDIKAAAPQ
eukprot:symbB.v1.2.015955.t1/scaffold1204.1/size131571/2